MTVRYGGVTIDWLGYATTRIEWPDGTVAYTDPGRYGVLTGEWEPNDPDLTDGHPAPTDYRAQDGDVVVVTHDHHYDSDCIRRVASEDATVVVYDAVYPPGIGRDVGPLDDLPYEVVRVDDEADLMFDDLIVRSVAAYTRPDEPGAEPSHPEGFGCGCLLTVGDTTVFWPGDTDVLEGHAELDVDVFLPPLDRRITMAPEEAADLGEAMDPGLVVPIHYNTFERLATDSGAFAADVAGRGIPVALDEQ
ncbi:hydrolase [Halobacteriales archaeon QS_1_68_20]|nr:MAG: hydrolase [Halobacteriales archaeon QS_1_68_20]